MTHGDLRAPFPYFGGKRRAAARIWDALGDPGLYVEPFAGSAAVLLARPPVSGRRGETINDLDGWLVNAWRSIQLSPVEVAAAAEGPNTENDLNARKAWLQARRDDDLVSWLEGHPEHHDAKAAGWWLYVMAAGIGDPFGPGPWQLVDGRLVDGRQLDPPVEGGGTTRAINYLGNAGRGIQRTTHGLGITSYMLTLAARLRHVRITCGSWERVLTPAALSGTAGHSGVGILMDPPYSTSGDLYATTNQRHATSHLDIPAQVRQWCLTEGRGHRIVLCGFEDEHDELLAHGWTREVGKSGSGSGYHTDPRAGRRERLWLSPECLSDQLFDLALLDGWSA